jgi:hypothetical protein
MAKKTENLTWTDEEAWLADLLGMRNWRAQNVREFFDCSDADIAQMVAGGLLPAPVMIGQGNRTAHLRP